MDFWFFCYIVYKMPMFYNMFFSNKVNFFYIFLIVTVLREKAGRQQEIIMYLFSKIYILVIILEINLSFEWYLKCSMLKDFFFLKLFSNPNI